MKTKHIIPVIVVMLLVGHYGSLSSQTTGPLFTDLDESDQAAIEALVMYPKDTRMTILEVIQYPAILIKLEGLQAQSSASFQETIKPYSQDEKSMIYDLSRYPGLISRLSLASEVGEKNIRSILADYPEIIHQRAKIAFTKYGALLSEIDSIQKEAEGAFKNLLKAYPDKIQAAFSDLVELPEVLSLLTENIRLTILVSDLYQKEPNYLLEQMDSLNLAIAEANTKELEDWQKSVADSPEVISDLKNASEAFSTEYDYDDKYYEYDDIYYKDKEEKYVLEQYFHYNYPYWFGYPSWYYYPRWRPYPFWYESGFYTVVDGGIVIHRLPSFYFTNWYFHRPYHHYYYPHLSRHFVRHTYYGPRPRISSVTVSVRNWQERNRNIVTDHWLQEDRKSIERFREFGKFEMDREKYNRKRPEKSLSPAAYLERNRSKYPELSRSAPARIQEGDRKIFSPRQKATIPDLNKQADQPVISPRRSNQSKVERERIIIKPKTRQVNPTRKVPKVNKGVDHHRTTIERSRKVEPKARVVPRKMPTAPKVKPKVVPKKKTRTKRSGG